MDGGSKSSFVKKNLASVESPDSTNDSKGVFELKSQLEDLVSEYNELVEEYDKDCSNVDKDVRRGIFRRKKDKEKNEDKESSQIDKEVLMVKATLYLMLKNGEINSDSEINIKDSIIDQMFNEDRRNEILKKFNESVLIDSIFRGNVFPVKENPMEVYKIKDPNKLFTSLGVLHGIGQLASSILNSPKNLFNKIRGSSTGDSQPIQPNPQLNPQPNPPPNPQPNPQPNPDPDPDPEPDPEPATGRVYNKLIIDFSP